MTDTTAAHIIATMARLEKLISERGFTHPDVALMLFQGRSSLRAEGRVPPSRFEDRVPAYVHFDPEDIITAEGFDDIVAQLEAKVHELENPEAIQRREFLKSLSDLKHRAEQMGLETEEFINPLTRMADQLASNAITHRTAAE